MGKCFTNIDICFTTSEVVVESGGADIGYLCSLSGHAIIKP